MSRQTIDQDIGPSASPAASRPTDRLAIWLHGERSWGHAPHERGNTLDRFEAAVEFAILEAAHLQHEPESRRAVVSRVEVSER